MAGSKAVEIMDQAGLHALPISLGCSDRYAIAMKKDTQALNKPEKRPLVWRVLDKVGIATRQSGISHRHEAANAMLKVVLLLIATGSSVNSDGLPSATSELSLLGRFEHVGVCELSRKAVEAEVRKSDQFSQKSVAVACVEEGVVEAIKSKIPWAFDKIVNYQP